MNSQDCNKSRPCWTKYRKPLLMMLCILLAGAGFLAFTYFHNMHGLNAFMEENYGKWDSDKNYWITSADEPHYVVCASQDIKINGEPHRMLAVCGQQPEKQQSHAASGYVDLYVMKYSFTGITPVAELTGIESGSFGNPGKVSVVRLGKEFYGFQEESGWSGQGYTNGYMSIYVPTGKTFHEALKFSSHADNSGVCDEEDENCSPRTQLVRTIMFIPKKGSSSYVARITSSGSVEGDPITTVHTLTFSPKKHLYIVPKDFKADMGY